MFIKHTQGHNLVLGLWKYDPAFKVVWNLIKETKNCKYTNMIVRVSWR